MRESSTNTGLRVLLALGALFVLVSTLAVVALQQALAPAPASPELTTRTPRRSLSPRQTTPAASALDVSGQVLAASGGPAEDVVVTVHTADHTVITTTTADGRFQLHLDAPGRISTDPPSVEDGRYVDASTNTLTLHLVPSCPLAVEALGLDGQPLTEHKVKARAHLAQGQDSAELAAFTDSAGVARFEALPCGVARVWTRHPGLPQARREGIDTLVEQRVTLRFTDGVHIHGTVTNPSGAPIEGARVSAGAASDHTDDAGSYGLIVDPAKLSRVQASAPGHVSEAPRLRVDNTQEDVVLDIVLTPARTVTVHCAGLPDDDCGPVEPLFCTRTWLPLGEACRRTSPRTCVCPEGEAAIRGGGATVAVEPGQDTVWLDLRDRGTLTGHARLDGGPAPCTATAIRLPAGLEDIPGGMAAGGLATCDPTGHFAIPGLKPGRYLLTVRAAGLSHDVPQIDIAAGITDIGTVELGGGGRIEGVVLDGVTGDGAPGETVLAVASHNDQLTGLGQAVSTTEGRFVIVGLEDGDYDVRLATRPLSTTPVTVSGGESDPIELTTGSAGLLDTHGFALETDDEGVLVVTDVDPDGSAADAGLEPGDRVVGVTVAGIDVGALFPDLADTVTDGVLDGWGGPGAGLVVERNGETIEVGL